MSGRKSWVQFQDLVGFFEPGFFFAQGNKFRVFLGVGLLDGDVHFFSSARTQLRIVDVLMPMTTSTARSAAALDEAPSASSSKYRRTACWRVSWS